jgi:hypothetical protein
METTRKSPVHLIFVGIEFVLAIVTLIPLSTASKESYLGYKALCSFTPFSTIGLLALVAVHIYLNRRKPAVV